MNKDITILAIESSCDDTSVAVLRDKTVLSNVIASQKIHEEYGGVVPELASRAHMQNIVPVVHTALKRASVSLNDLSAIAYTRGPGLLGSLLVGTSFAKSLALSLHIPLLDVNHLQGHVMATFLTENPPVFPFLCLLVSGGNSQIVKVTDYNCYEILGQTIDDAAGEAFDKCAKMMQLPYPGGAVIDKLAGQGDPHRFTFAKPHLVGYDYSFSGLKTSFLYFLRDNLKTNPNFIEENKADLCASLQTTIIDILMAKLLKAARDLQIGEIAIGGGVSANSQLRQTMLQYGEKYHWNVHIPPFEYTTDNAAMIAISAYYKYLNRDFSGINLPPFAKMTGE